MKKLTGYTYLELIYNKICLFSKCFNLLPNLIEEFFEGFGVVLILISFYYQTHDMYKLRDYKKLYLIEYYQNSISNKYLKKYSKFLLK